MSICNLFANLIWIENCEFWTVSNHVSHIVWRELQAYSYALFQMFFMQTYYTFRRVTNTYVLHISNKYYISRGRPPTCRFRQETQLRRIHICNTVPRYGRLLLSAYAYTLYIYQTRKRSRVGIRCSYFSTEHNVQAQTVYHICQSIVRHARANIREIPRIMHI